MPEVRVVVASSNVSGRRAIQAALGNAEVLAATPDLRTATARARQFQPDAVVVDADVALDGMAELRAAAPRATVFLVVGTRARREEAARGSGLVAVTSAAEVAAKLGTMGDAGRRSPAATVSPTARRGPAPRVDLIAIGSSTGGPAALATVLRGLPSSLPVPVVLVQHIPAAFTRVLAARLDTTTGLTVREAQGGERPVAGEVWLAPGDRHLVVAREGDQLVLRLTSEPPECFCRPSVDVLFRSLGAALGPHCLGVVLTGMGQDGLRGASLLKGVGAQVLAQDEATSVVWGMPGYVARAGIAERVLPLDQIAQEIVSRVAAARGAGTPGPRRQPGSAP